MPSVINVSWQKIDSPRTGGQLRSYHLLSRLPKLDLLVLGPDRHIGGLRARFVPDLGIWGFYRFLRSRVSFDVHGLRMLDPLYIVGIIVQLVRRRPEIVIADSHIVFWPCYIGARLTGARLILNSHNVVHVTHSARRGYLYWVLYWTEQLMFRLADVVMVCSQIERRYCVTCMRLTAETIVVVPNGVVYRSVLASDSQTRAPEGGHCMPDADTRTILFVGKLDYGPNQQAAAFIEHRLAPRYENRKVLFLIVGQSHAGPGRCRNVVRTGFVKDLRPLYAGAHLALAPIFSGSGTRLKILEYAAHGIPTVSTPKGCEGLDLEDLHIAADAAEICRQMDRILAANPQRSISLRLSVQKYDWDLIGREFQTFLKGMLWR